VFNDPCAPNPPQPPSDPSTCQDVSELFTSVATDDAGNVYVAYIRRDASQPHPEYDVNLAVSRDGGRTFTSHVINSDTGTHYMPWVAAAGDGGVDVVYYDTPVVAGVGQFNKPAAAPATAQWTVQMSQSLDGGRTWTQSQVSDHPVYFGDICSTGIFCGQGSQFGWGDDRILFDDFGVAVGPDGGARVAWTDAHDSWTGKCQPGGTVSCQTTHVEFACQSGGTGLGGQQITGCGAVKGEVAASQLPSRRCASRRVLVVHLRGVSRRGLRATLDGRRLRVRRGRTPTVLVVLRGRPRGGFRLRVTGRRLNGRRYRRASTLHTCVPRPRR